MENEKIELNVNGVDVTVDPEDLNDLDVLDWLDEINEGRPLKLKKLLERMLGDSWRAVYDSLKDERGRVRSSDASSFLVAFMGAVEEKK